MSSIEERLKKLEEENKMLKKAITSSQPNTLASLGNSSYQMDCFSRSLEANNNAQWLYNSMEAVRNMNLKF